MYSSGAAEGSGVPVGSGVCFSDASAVGSGVPEIGDSAAGASVGPGVLSILEHAEKTQQERIKSAARQRDTVFFIRLFI